MIQSVRRIPKTLQEVSVEQGKIKTPKVCKKIIQTLSAEQIRALRCMTMSLCSPNAEGCGSLIFSPSDSMGIVCPARKSRNRNVCALIPKEGSGYGLSVPFPFSGTRIQ